MARANEEAEPGSRLLSLISNHSPEQLMSHQFLFPAFPFSFALTLLVYKNSQDFFFSCLCSLSEPPPPPESLLMNQIALRLELQGRQPHLLPAVDGVAAPRSTLALSQCRRVDVYF